MIRFNERLSDSLSKTVTLLPCSDTWTILYTYIDSVSTDKQTPLYIPIIILGIHISTQKKTHWCVVVEQQFNSSVYLSFLLQHSQLKPLILPWGPERMKVAWREPSGLECWCLYAVLVGVVLKHRSQSVYCAVHSQINEDRQVRAAPSAPAEWGYWKSLGKSLGNFQLF